MANTILIKSGTRTQVETAKTNNLLKPAEPYLITGEGRLAVGLTSGSYASFVKEDELKDATLTLQTGAAAATATTVTIGTGTGFSANTATNATYTIRVGPALTDLADTMTGAGTGFLKKDGADNFILDTNSYLTGNQTITASGDASGSGTTTLALTLATVNSNVGEFTKVTVNGKGLVTAATSLVASDIPSLTAAKISDFNTAVQTSRLDQMAAPTGSVSLNSQKITGLADPQNAQDAATKAYVDSAAQGVVTKNSVRAATTADITLSGTQTIDGVNVIADDRVLVKNQSTAHQNGIYVVAAGAWSRAADANTWNELISAYTFVEEGTLNADNGYLITVNAGGTLGVTDVTVAQFSGAGQITAGAGLTKTGNQIDVVGTANRIVANGDSIDIDSAYVGQASITTLGTVATGTWSATAIGVTKGGTGLTAAVSGLLKGNGTAYSAATAGTDYLAPDSTIDGGEF
jgi:hypothetical protein